jgi:hypothetical protein
MRQRGSADPSPLQHLLHQVNPPTRAIQFIALDLVSWARRVAKTAMHAFAQNGIGFLALRGIADIRVYMGLHD